MANGVHKILIPLLIAFSLLFCAKCGEGDDLGRITQEMRDKLGDALGFDGGEYFDGPPPEEHAGDSAFPQITDFSAPDELEQGEEFEIVLVTDFASIDEIKGAVVYVEDAQNHVRIKKELVAGVDFKLAATGNLPGGDGQASESHMVLSGSVTEEMDELWGHKYSIFIGMLTADDEVGNYVTWGLELPRLEKEASEGESEGEGEGESDGDASGIVILRCKSDEFSCSDSQAQEVWDAQNNANTCNTTTCDSSYNTQEEAAVYSNCISCCFKNELTEAVDKEQYVECWACFYYVYEMQSGSSGTKEEAYGKATEQWDAYEYSAAACVE